MLKKIVVPFVIILSGCVSTPDKATLERADYGALPNDYKELIAGKISNNLKDPLSAMYKYAEPYKGWCKSGFGTYYGWLVRVSVNAKNSYGAYTGNQSKMYLINNKNALDYSASYQVGGCGKS